MKELTIVSKRHGSFTTQLDDEDFERIKKLGGKWCVCIKRGGKVYFQKRIDFAARKGGRIIELHRYIMGEPAGLVVDHIDGNTLDNQRSNLRACLNRANLRNTRTRANNTSGHIGVRQPRTGKSWEARIRVNYRIIVLGRYKTYEEAVEARKEAEQKYWTS